MVSMQDSTVSKEFVVEGFSLRWHGPSDEQQIVVEPGQPSYLLRPLNCSMQLSVLTGGCSESAKICMYELLSMYWSTAHLAASLRGLAGCMLHISRCQAESLQCQLHWCPDQSSGLAMRSSMTNVSGALGEATAQPCSCRRECSAAGWSIAPCCIAVPAISGVAGLAEPGA